MSLVDEWRYEFENWVSRMESFPVELIESIDNSESYEMDRKHIFRLENGMFAVVKESGCSCYERSDADIELFKTIDEAIKSFELKDVWDDNKWTAYKAREWKNKNGAKNE